MVLSPQIFQINIPNSSENCCCVNIFTASFVYFPALRGGGEQKTPWWSASPVPGASGRSLPRPPSRDGRRDGLSPSTITRGAITPLPSWPLPFASLYSFLRLQDLAEKSPPRFQAAPSFTAQAGEGGEGAQIPLPHPSVGTATSPSKGPAPTRAAVLLLPGFTMCPSPKEGTFPTCSRFARLGARRSLAQRSAWTRCDTQRPRLYPCGSAGAQWHPKNVLAAPPKPSRLP